MPLKEQQEISASLGKQKYKQKWLGHFFLIMLSIKALEKHLSKNEKDQSRARQEQKTFSA